MSFPIQALILLLPNGRIDAPSPRRLSFSFLRFQSSDAIPSRFLRNDKDSGTPYPNQHIDSDCFPADLPVFELCYTGYPFDEFVELDYRRQTTRLGRRHALRTFYASALLLSMLLGGALDFVSGFQLQRKAIPFPGQIPSVMSFHRPSRAPLAALERAKRYCTIDERRPKSLLVYVRI